MAGVRSLYRGATMKGYAVKGTCPIRCDDTTNLIMINPSATGTTEVAMMASASASGARIAAGSGALVTGALTVATGLTSILSATAVNTVQPNATGVSSSQILVPTWTTGSLTITAYFISSSTGATSAASSATGTVAWTAVGL